MSRPERQDPLDVVSSTAEAAFATDHTGRIIIWNRAAEDLLGFSSASVLGRSCCTILQGKDVFGNTYCGESCSLMAMARSHEPIHHFEMDVHSSTGSTIHAAFSIMVVPGAKRGAFNLVHVLHPVSRGREADELLRRILRASPAAEPQAGPLPPPAADEPAVPLTSREIEVLRLMADGSSTRKIADELFISTATARNHIQHIIEKLGVHSKLEAVSLAFRRSLI